MNLSQNAVGIPSKQDPYFHHHQSAAVTNQDKTRHKTKKSKESKVLTRPGILLDNRNLGPLHQLDLPPIGIRQWPGHGDDHGGPFVGTALEAKDGDGRVAEHDALAHDALRWRAPAGGRRRRVEAEGVVVRGGCGAGGGRGGGGPASGSSRAGDRSTAVVVAAAAGGGPLGGASTLGFASAVLSPAPGGDTEWGGHRGRRTEEGTPGGDGGVKTEGATPGGDGVLRTCRGGVRGGGRRGETRLPLAHDY